MQDLHAWNSFEEIFLFSYNILYNWNMTSKFSMTINAIEKTVSHKTHPMFFKKKQTNIQTLFYV